MVEVSFDGVIKINFHEKWVQQLTQCLTEDIIKIFEDNNKSIFCAHNLYMRQNKILRNKNMPDSQPTLIQPSTLIITFHNIIHHLSRFKQMTNK